MNAHVCQADWSKSSPVELADRIWVKHLLLEARFVGKQLRLRSNSLYRSPSVRTGAVELVAELTE